MRLQASIDRLYEVFSVYRVRTVHGCAHCVSPEELKALTATPLRELSATVLSRYVWSAVTTIGTVRDFKHFLPRLLELSLPDEFWLDLKLTYAQWDAWPAPERDAIGAFRAELVMNELKTDRPVAFERFSRLLSQFQHVQPRLEALLNASAHVPRWYAQLICDLGQFHNRLTPAQEVLLDWLLVDRRTNALEQAFFAEADPRAAALYSNAVLVLDWF